MRKLWLLIALICILRNGAIAQELGKDTLKKVSLSEVVITATRTEHPVKEVPVRTEVLTKADIEMYPVNNTDDILSVIPGANVDRSFGIFSKSASITLRGINSAQRTLVMLDGIPINKADGGAINWNRVEPDEIDHIEVVKGPMSALYGGTAMAGAINIITIRPAKKLTAFAKVFYGTDNTYGGKLILSGSTPAAKQGFFWDAMAFSRKGDGYILYPDSTRDSNDIKAFLQEDQASARLGYRFANQITAEVEFQYAKDKRGDGLKFFDPDGGYTATLTRFIRGQIRKKSGKIKWELNTWYQNENLHAQKENIKQDKVPPYAITGYQLYQTDAARNDEGCILNIAVIPAKNNNLIMGLDIRQGSVDYTDTYFSSTDIISNKGMMNFYAMYVQDEARFLHNRLKINAGIRVDHITFSDGNFNVITPSTSNEILVPYTGDFSNSSWDAISPKISARYDLSQKISLYTGFGTGFRAPILDDICRNGNISKGFKLANPKLKPETLDNYELGADITPTSDILIQPSLFYSVGKNFQYFVGTGDSITSGNNLKPVLTRENIGKVGITGAEINLNWTLSKAWFFNCNYGYYHSVITSFNLTRFKAKDLTGKDLMEVAPNIVNALVTYTHGIYRIALYYHFKDHQWTDDENTIKAPVQYSFDGKITLEPMKNLKIGFGVKNITGKVFIDEKGQITPGRFVMLDISYKIERL